MSSKPSPDDSLSLYIEIVSGRDLLAADKTGKSDPYVKVIINGETIHKTGHVKQTLNPTFTAAYKNICVWNGPARDVQDGILFHCKDWDRFGSNDDLGTVVVPAETLWKLDHATTTTTPTEYPITAPKGVTASCGFLTLCIRHATAADREKYHGKTSAMAKFWTPIKAVAEKITPHHHHHHDAPASKTPPVEKAAPPAVEPTAPAEPVPAIEVAIRAVEPTAEPGPAKAAVPSLLTEEPVIVENPTVTTAAAPVDAGAPAPVTTGAEETQVPTEDKDIHIEIVSARNLLAGDKNGLSDPYVKIKLGGKNLHETKVIKKTLNPVFSAAQNNFYVLKCTAKELFDHQKIEFKVKDWDRIGANDELGSVEVPAATLYAMVDKSEEKEFAISPPKGHEGEAAGFLTIRCRPPTLGDTEDYKAAKWRLRQPKQEPASSHDAPVDMTGMVDINDKILLVEILSGRDLIVADKSGTSDPYVKIIMGKEDLHKTAVIKKTVNPVFTEEDKNSYVLDCTAMDLFSKGGLLFKLKDWDRGIGGNDEMGSVKVSAETLYNFGPEPREFPIDPPPGKSDAAGFLTLSCLQISAAERDERKKGGFLKRLRGVPETKSRGEVDLSDLSLLVEIVSCQKLLKADLTTSDPYVKVTYLDKEVHKTKNIQNTTDPIYTINQGSVFILNVMKDEFAASELKFTVKDYDTVGKNDELGTVVIPGKELCEATGDRKTYKLVPPAKSKKTEAGVINIRCRPATNYDRKFLEYVNGDRKGGFMGIDQTTEIVMKPRGGSRKLVKEKIATVETSGPDAGVKKYKVRPDPDPERAAMTKWLSDAQIQEETMKPSRKWINIGSGSLGKVFLEILGADELPNLDTSVRGRDKSDPFAMVVYEDCCAKTDIIDDCLSPRWLPWAQRAFVFNMDHASSDIFVGIFDYDGTIGNQHDLIGRVAIELSSLRPKTDYVLSYDLYDETLSSDRKKRGSITVRVRVEYASQRDLVLSNLRVPPEEYINVKNKKDFLLIRKVIQGNTDIVKYSLNTITTYIEELTAYLFVQYYIMDSVISLLFWRGQVPFAFGFKLPLHSLIAFLAAISMAERPSLYFSYFWFANAWLLLAIQNWRNNTPHAWNRTKSFGQIFAMLVLDRAMSGPETIPENYKQEESEAFEEEMKKRIEKAEAAAEKRRQEEMKLLAEHEKQMADMEMTAETDISTQSTGMSLDPLKPFLYPVQQMLSTVCVGVRFVRNVYIWEEPYFAFFLTAASLVIGLVFLFVPWAFLIRWTGRIVAWGVFGPHMKLVDIFYYSKLKPATEEEESKQLSEYYEGQRKVAEATALAALIETEEAQKLKAVKKLLYGSYIVRVPVVKGERFREVPLHKSSAKPHKEEDNSETALRATTVRIGGQQLVGNMIPKVSIASGGSGRPGGQNNVGGSKKEPVKGQYDVESNETTPLLPK